MNPEQLPAVGQEQLATMKHILTMQKITLVLLLVVSIVVGCADVRANDPCWSVAVVRVLMIVLMVWACRIHKQDRRDYAARTTQKTEGSP